MASELHIAISRWLEGLPQPDNHFLIDELQPLAKKRKIHHGSIHLPSPNKSTASSIPGLSSQSSQRSGRSSSIQNFPIQGIGTHSLTSRTLNPNQRDMPPALLDLLGEMEDIGMCYGVIPSYLEVRGAPAQ